MQQRQEIRIGKEPFPRFIQVIALLMSFVVLLGCGLLFTGKLSEVELFRPDHGGKSGFAQASVWLIGFAIICPVFMLTRRQHAFTLVGQQVSVQENSQLVWNKKCATWRWRISDKKNVLGVELLDDEGGAYLVRLGGIPLGTRQPFAPLIEALTGAGVQEAEPNTKPLPFSKDIGAMLAATLALIAAGGFTWLVWAALHAFDR